MKRFLPFAALLLSAFAACGWILIHPLQSLVADTALGPDALKTLPPEAQKIAGTLTTLAYSFQFFIYGEKRMPKNLEELVGSPYFPLPMTEMTHPGGRESAQFYSYLAMMPSDVNVGDFAVIQDAYGLIRLQSVVRVPTPQPDGTAPLKPHLVEIVYSNDDLNAVGAYGNPAGESAVTIHGYALEDQQTYWNCALMNAAAQDLALHQFPPWRTAPASVKSLAEIQAAPWFANLHVVNPYMHRPPQAVRPEAPRPGDYTPYQATYKLTPAPAPGDLSLGKAVEIHYPAFVCYGTNLKPVNPSVLHELGEKPAPGGLRPAPKTPPLF